MGQKTHVSARYILKIGSKEEVHSSSGIIISTGLGSTGWLTSILTGAKAVAIGTSKDKPQLNLKVKTSWSANHLYYSVREPFPSKTSSTNLVFGVITPKTPLVITSQMPENGVIFSDGVENDYLEFNSGSIATIGIAEKKAYIVY
jgi:hypothetical protein